MRHGPCNRQHVNKWFSVKSTKPKYHLDSLRKKITSQAAGKIYSQVPVQTAWADVIITMMIVIGAASEIG